MTAAGFATINPIATLVPPAEHTQQPTQQDVANAAHTLVAQFGQPESTQSRTRAIWDMARILTVAEFSTAMTKALEQAAANDKAAGWVPPSDAKGRAKYGPSQSTLATVASQCRQVFGACKIDPECIVSLPENGLVNPDLFPNWSTAYTKAREFLADKGIDWQGQSVAATKAAKETKQATDANSAILAEVMAQNPQQAGESMADYMARIADDVEAFQADAASKATEEAAKKELTRLIKVHGDNVADILTAMVKQYNAMQEPAPM